MGDDEHYPKAYGQWAGNEAGRKPDFTRCCKNLFDIRSAPGGYQCSRKRGHGPGGAYCKVHDPKAVKARREASMQKYYLETDRKQVEWHGPKFLAVLRKIAEGHNDPRSAAQSVIAEYEGSLRASRPEEPN